MFNSCRTNLGWANGMLIGLAIGLATSNLAIGLALGIVFAISGSKQSCCFK